MTKFVLIGHVDHGKSTCAGRILVDNNLVDERTIAKVIENANKKGMGSWWLSHFLDQDEEQERGKTHQHISVDINYKDKMCTLVDVPGHRDFVSEMIMGSIGADVAVLICSAKSGELEDGIKGQTLEHLLLVRGIGINKLIIAVNKMDHETVNWDIKIFETITSKLNKLTKKFGFSNVEYVPISAFDGVNIIENEKTKVLDKKRILMDSIVNTEVKSQEAKIYENITKFRAKCIFVDVGIPISKGFVCKLHSGKTVVEAKISKIFLTRQFIIPADMDKGCINIALQLSEPSKISDNIILRFGNRTVAVGKIITK